MVSYAYVYDPSGLIPISPLLAISFILPKEDAISSCSSVSL